MTALPSQINHSCPWKSWFYKAARTYEILNGKVNTTEKFAKRWHTKKTKKIVKVRYIPTIWHSEGLNDQKNFNESENVNPWR